MTAKRLCAALLALAVCVTIVTRIWLRIDRYDIGLLDTLAFNYRYFTLWTNTLVGLTCAWVALGGREPAKVQGGLLLSIAMVAIVYHVLLAHLRDYQGIDRVIDVMLHTALPLAFAGYWLAFVKKAHLRYADILPWLILPLLYCIVAMLRATFLDGRYPYHFLNLADLGPLRTGINIFGLLVVFSGFGALIVWAGQRLGRRPVFAGSAS
ncbi:MAG: Pr6Pr family membrane protein [Marivita sp.]|uniref:Pr6Pr family membrane protein n=1 Tax=Marivita sp. TaxID=2003365 RepID=UPI0025C5C289|nr:Pr6Pr family membrane protein [Marivita sp.]MCI5112785.1 Pr6Pr family membrane protein [Marivita sp.]